jgi:hypothetical protein
VTGLVRRGRSDLSCCMFRFVNGGVSMGIGGDTTTTTIPDEPRRRLWRSRWAAIGAAIAVTFGGGGLFVANAASSPPSSVVTIDPVRILDTRDPVNIGLPGPFVSAISQKLQVTGSAVPAGSTGVLLNVTVVTPTADGFLSVRPGDATGAPSTSSLNFTAGDIVPNSVQVGLPTVGANAGQIDITYDAFGVAGPTTEVLIDVVGYMVAGGAGTGPAGATGAQGDQGIQGPAGPSTQLPPVGQFTTTQIVKDAILTCVSVTENGLKCNTPRLNNVRVSANGGGVSLICLTIFGTEESDREADDAGSNPVYAWNGSNWFIDTPPAIQILSFSCNPMVP